MGVGRAAGIGCMQAVEMWRRGWREGFGAGGLERAGAGMCWRRVGHWGGIEWVAGWLWLWCRIRPEKILAEGKEARQVELGMGRRWE